MKSGTLAARLPGFFFDRRWHCEKAATRKVLVEIQRDGTVAFRWKGSGKQGCAGAEPN